jgi:hypothetical protein
VLLREACLAVTFEASEAPWAAELRRKLKAMDGCCAWQPGIPRYPGDGMDGTGWEGKMLGTCWEVLFFGICDLSYLREILFI